jgi:hypothetical protein
VSVWKYSMVHEYCQSSAILHLIYSLHKAVDARSRLDRLKSFVLKWQSMCTLFGCLITGIVHGGYHTSDCHTFCYSWKSVNQHLLTSYCCGLRPDSRSVVYYMHCRPFVLFMFLALDGVLLRRQCSTGRPAASHEIRNRDKCSTSKYS